MDIEAKLRLNYTEVAQCDAFNGDTVSANITAVVTDADLWTILDHMQRFLQMIGFTYVTKLTAVTGNGSECSSGE